ncbi:hypothetical protein [Streptomyces antimicrobicus]|uniref:Uncharacterized protein n=1 Tax=Streptomyces antimicrobicus TaxID=2883108 RepID=A0ABS8BAC0_9ACTN|nr:hypothetical protein [Streptomyces antimicrobicus]MCB5181552.1 hypothetical protein [Streptomyces antimicrobicus]
MSCHRGDRNGAPPRAATQLRVRGGERATADGRPQGFGGGFARTLLTTYALRTAAVLVFTTSAVGRRLGVLPRPVIAAGTAAGLVLLVVSSAVPRSELVLPAWALLVGLYVLRAARRTA